MHIEYEEFDSIQDFFMYMAAAAPPMKNTMPINSYKGYIMAFIPLSPSTGDSYLMILIHTAPDITNIADTKATSPISIVYKNKLENESSNKRLKPH